MGDWNIQLKTTGLNSWIMEVEEKLTKVKDFLDVLEQEEQSLKKVFDSQARVTWEKVFQSHMDRLRGRAGEMERLTLMVEEAAWSLAELEKSMVAQAEEVR